MVGWRSLLLAVAALAGACSFGFDPADLTRDRSAGPGASGDAGPAESAYGAAVLADDPVGFYGLDEPAGTDVAKDLSPRGNDCTYGAAVERGVPGLAGSRAARFGGGPGAYVTCGEAFAFDGDRPFTVEVWVRVDPARAFDSVYRRVWSREGADDAKQRGFYLLFHREERLLVSATRWLDGAERGTHSGASFDGAVFGAGYQHLVVTYGAGTVTLFHDGRKVAEGRSAGLVAGGAPFVIAGTSYDLPRGGGGFVGDLDALAVYDRALDAARVAEHYRLGASP